MTSITGMLQAYKVVNLWKAPGTEQVVNDCFLPAGKQHEKTMGVINTFYENVKNRIALPI